MITNNPNKTIVLKDERTLGYAEYGDSTGKPVFHFHGGGAGSRLLAQTIDTVAVQVGVRIIAPDRPGIGLSDFKPGYMISDWTDDVGELADALDIPRFAIMSESGGSPYVASCARKISERLSSATIVSGTCPLDAPHVTKGMSAQNRFMISLAQKAPLWLLRLFFAQMIRLLRKRPDKFFSQSMKGIPDSDRAVMSKPEFQKVLLESFLAAFQQGTRGPAWDIRLIMRPWGFRLQDISMEIQLWHGEADQNVPIAMAHYMKNTIPKCQATFYPEEGHISVLHNHTQEILENLISEKRF